MTLTENSPQCIDSVQADASKKYFTLLPREYYISEDIFIQEKQNFLLQHWHFATHVSDIPKAGDYVVVELLGESVIVMRGRDGRISAVNNVCRHRGHSICVEPKGNKRRLTCPYHAWTYDLEGKLIAAPSLDDGTHIDYSDWGGLKKVYVEVWRGCVFIALREPMEKSLSARLDAVAPQMLPPLELENVRKVAESTHVMNANWKVLVENYHECYHCAGNHPELNGAMDLDGMYEETNNPDRLTQSTVAVLRCGREWSPLPWMASLVRVPPFWANTAAADPLRSLQRRLRNLAHAHQGYFQPPRPRHYPDRSPVEA